MAYIDNKVFVSLKNGELAIFRRHYSIWNYDNYTVRTIAQNPFNCMLTVAGKLWCSSNSTIIVLSPTMVTIDVSVQLNIYSFCFAFIEVIFNPVKGEKINFGIVKNFFDKNVSLGRKLKNSLF